MDILDEFSTRLKEQMEENNLTVMKLYELSGCPVSNISKWLNRKNCPLLPSLVKLADVFNCSVDYLVGRSDNPGVCPGSFKRKPGRKNKNAVQGQNALPPCQKHKNQQLSDIFMD